MALQEFEDKAQEKFRLLVDDGYYLPEALAGSLGHLKELKHWETRANDILVCTYPKSGTMWVWDIVCMLLKNERNVQKQTFDTSNLELNSIAKLDDLPSPRVLQTHMIPRYLPNSFVERKNKIIYGIRDPRDVAVSLYSFMIKLHDKWSTYKGSWENFLPIFLEGKVGYGSWFEHINCMERLRKDKDYPVLFVSYEDLHKNGEETVKKMAQFLEVDVCDDAVKEVVKNTKFDNFREKKIQAAGPKLKSLSSDGSEPYFRKGIVGDWRNRFSEDEIQNFERVMDQQCGNSEIIEMYLKRE